MTDTFSHAAEEDARNDALMLYVRYRIVPVKQRTALGAWLQLGRCKIGVYADTVHLLPFEFSINLIVGVRANEATYVW